MSIYKDNIVQEVGGKCEFDYLIMAYCKSIREDFSLSVFFAHLDLRGLIELQSECLNAAFLNVPQQKTKSLVLRLAVRHQTLLKMGMDEAHFEKLKALFIKTLQGCWLSDRLIQAAEKHFDSLRLLFQRRSTYNASNFSQPKAHHNFNRTGATSLQHMA